MLVIIFIGAQAAGEALFDQILKPRIDKRKSKILPSENKQSDDYETRYHAGEVAYHKCLDHIASLSTWSKQMVKSPLSDREYEETTEHNEYFEKWIDNGRPFYDMKIGYWEVAFMKWMIENKPNFCESTDQIRFFITERKKVIDNIQPVSGNFFLTHPSRARKRITIVLILVLALMLKRFLVQTIRKQTHMN